MYRTTCVKRRAINIGSNIVSFKSPLLVDLPLLVIYGDKRQPKKLHHKKRCGSQHIFERRNQILKLFLCW